MEGTTQTLTPWATIFFQRQVGIFSLSRHGLRFVIKISYTSLRLISRREKTLCVYPMDRNLDLKKALKKLSGESGHERTRDFQFRSNIMCKKTCKARGRGSKHFFSRTGGRGMVIRAKRHCGEAERNEDRKGRNADGRAQYRIIYFAPWSHRSFVFFFWWMEMESDENSDRFSYVCARRVNLFYFVCVSSIPSTFETKLLWSSYRDNFRRQMFKLSRIQV